MIKKFIALLGIFSLTVFTSAALAGSCCAGGGSDDGESDASMGQQPIVSACGCGGGDEA